MNIWSALSDRDYYGEDEPTLVWDRNFPKGCYAWLKPKTYPRCQGDCGAQLTKRYQRKRGLCDACWEQHERDYDEYLRGAP